MYSYSYIARVKNIFWNIFKCTCIYGKTHAHRYTFEHIHTQTNIINHKYTHTDADTHTYIYKFYSLVQTDTCLHYQIKVPRPVMANKHLVSLACSPGISPAVCYTSRGITGLASFRSGIYGT